MKIIVKKIYNKSIGGLKDEGSTVCRVKRDRNERL